MFAIASLLDSPTCQLVESLWGKLETQCGLYGIQLTPYPHFSWQLAEGYDESRLLPALSQVAVNTRPFTVRTSGIGVFTPAAPVVYLAIVKDNLLSAFHRQIWEIAYPVADQPNLHYTPESWIPHITLARSDVTRDNLGCAVSQLSDQPLALDICVDHLALVFQTGDQVGQLKYRFEFGGPNESQG